MSIIHTIANEIAKHPSLAGVPRPILDAVTERALAEFWSRLDDTDVMLDGLSACECGAISADCTSTEDVTLCPTCWAESMRCDASPTKEHEPATDDAETTCAHCDVEMV